MKMIRCLSNIINIRNRNDIIVKHNYKVLYSYPLIQAGEDEGGIKGVVS